METETDVNEGSSSKSLLPQAVAEVKLEEYPSTDISQYDESYLDNKLSVKLEPLFDISGMLLQNDNDMNKAYSNPISNEEYIKTEGEFFGENEKSNDSLSIAEIPISISEIPESISEIPESISEIPEAISEIPEAISEIPESISEYQPIIQLSGASKRKRFQSPLSSTLIPQHYDKCDNSMKLFEPFNYLTPNELWAVTAKTPVEEENDFLGFDCENSEITRRIKRLKKIKRDLKYYTYEYVPIIPQTSFLYCDDSNSSHGSSSTNTRPSRKIKRKRHFDEICSERENDKMNTAFEKVLKYFESSDTHTDSNYTKRPTTKQLVSQISNKYDTMYGGGYSPSKSVQGEHTLKKYNGVKVISNATIQRNLDAGSVEGTANNGKIEKLQRSIRLQSLDDIMKRQAEMESKINKNSKKNRSRSQVQLPVILDKSVKVVLHKLNLSSVTEDFVAKHDINHVSVSRLCYNLLNMQIRRNGADDSEDLLPTEMDSQVESSITSYDTFNDSYSSYLSSYHEENDVQDAPNENFDALSNINSQTNHISESDNETRSSFSSFNDHFTNAELANHSFSSTTAPPTFTSSPSSKTAPPSSKTAPPSSKTAPPSITTAPLSITTAPPSFTTAPPSFTTAPPSFTTAPPSFTTAPPSFTTAPPSFTTAPPSFTTAPPSFTTAPASFNTAPASFTTAPASFTTAPASFTTAPASFTTAPASFTTAPASFTTAPSSFSTGPPSFSTGPPAITTALPSITTPPPSITTPPPSITTAPLSFSNAPLSFSNASPSITTAPPSITTAPPSITTAPPPITTAPPSIKTAPTSISISPSILTFPPSILTFPPSILTFPPSILTSPPSILTSPPSIPTSSFFTAPSSITSPSSSTAPPSSTLTPLKRKLSKEFDIGLPLNEDNTPNKKPRFSTEEMVSPVVESNATANLSCSTTDKNITTENCSHENIFLKEVDRESAPNKNGVATLEKNKTNIFQKENIQFDECKESEDRLLEDNGDDFSEEVEKTLSKSSSNNSMKMKGVCSKMLGDKCTLKTNPNVDDVIESTNLSDKLDSNNFARDFNRENENVIVAKETTEQHSQKRDASVVSVTSIRRSRRKVHKPKKLEQNDEIMKFFKNDNLSKKPAHNEPIVDGACQEASSSSSQVASSTADHVREGRMDCISNHVPEFDDVNSPELDNIEIPEVPIVSAESTSDIALKTKDRLLATDSTSKTVDEVSPTQDQCQNSNSANSSSNKDVFDVISLSDDDDDLEIVSENIVKKYSSNVKSVKMTLSVPGKLGETSLADIMKNYSILNKNDNTKSNLTISNLISNCDENGKVFLSQIPVTDQNKNGVKVIDNAIKSTERKTSDNANKALRNFRPKPNKTTNIPTFSQSKSGSFSISEKVNEYGQYTLPNIGILSNARTVVISSKNQRIAENPKNSSLSYRNSSNNTDAVEGKKSEKLVPGVKITSLSNNNSSINTKAVKEKKSNKLAPGVKINSLSDNNSSNNMKAIKEKKSDKLVSGVKITSITSIPPTGNPNKLGLDVKNLPLTTEHVSTKNKFVRPKPTICVVPPTPRLQGALNCEV